MLYNLPEEIIKSHCISVMPLWLIVMPSTLLGAIKEQAAVAADNIIVQKFQ